MTVKTAFVVVGLVSLPNLLTAQPLETPVGRVVETERTIAGSERVVVGRVVAIEPVFFQNEYGDELIISRTTVVVDETLKGPAATTVEVMVEGGSIGELTFTVSDLEPVALGERGVFMLSKHRSGLLVPHNRGYGLLSLDENGRIRDSSLTLGDVRSAARRVSGR